MGRDYFKGRANVLRVQAWRKAHPGYWRRQRKRQDALQDLSSPQAQAKQADAPGLTADALQDVLSTQGSLLIGLIANLTGSALQDHIDSTAQRLILLGRQFRGLGVLRGANDGDQTSALPTAPAQGALPVQLDRSPPGSG
jgi:hypothetical protein